MTMCKGSRTSPRFSEDHRIRRASRTYRHYQLHLAASGVGVPTINQTVSTLRFFFKVTLKRHEIVEHTRVATKTISGVMSPLEHIALKLKEIRPPG